MIGFFTKKKRYICNEIKKLTQPYLKMNFDISAKNLKIYQVYNVYQSIIFDFAF